MPRHKFSALFTGYIRLMKSGTYQFRTTSGDGSNVYIDGEKVLDNFGLHPMDKFNIKQYWEYAKSSLTLALK